MSITFVIDNIAQFTVKGSFKNAKGTDVPFSFQLTCKRLAADEIQDRLRASEELSIADFFVELTEDWAGVKDAEGHPVPYSPESLRQLFKLPGLAGIALRTYLEETSAKAKN